jgi:hypothetical protein
MPEQERPKIVAKIVQEEVVMGMMIVDGEEVEIKEILERVIYEVE